MTKEQCPRCFGRGYIPEKCRRKLSPYHGGTGLYLRNCPRCGGRGEIDHKPRKGD
jgi:ribosomal protein S27AE